jgi:hypothetical protein
MFADLGGLRFLQTGWEHKRGHASRDDAETAVRFQQSWQAALEAKEAQMEVVEKEGTGELI